MADARSAGAAHARGYQGTPLQVAVRWQVLHGHAHGLRGPVLLGSVRWPVNASWDSAALAAILNEGGGLAPDDTERCLAGGFGIDAFLALVRALEMAAQSPVTQVGVQVAPAAVREGSVQHSVALPSFLPKFTQALIGWLVAAINACHGAFPPQQRRALAEAANAQLEEARAAFRTRINANGVNTVRIARTCGEMDLPLRWLPAGFIHVGSGPYGRLFRSTLTESTPALATTLARSKSLTASLLAQHGLPVPRHRLVGSVQEALQAAHALGYPVVVKPEDRDGGDGVHAGLRTDEQVRQCYALAAAISRKVLVETHVDGQDYRITVDNGRVVKVIGRQPGGVLGDGRRTVEELIRDAAAAMRAARTGRSVVSMDDEALALLAERGMTARSVPAAGDFVVLRRRANMSTGGTSRNALDDLHPDNARLAVRAAQALRLDVAGIDLIIPDIAVSWMHCEAAICEVNAQPQISTEFAPTIYRDLLARMVPAPGRMRAVLLLHALGNLDSDDGVAEASEQLMRRGERVLSVRGNGTWLGDERLTPPGRDAFAAAMAAELEREATAVVAALTPEQVLQKGLPWLHLDQVRVLSGMGPADMPRLRACLELLAPHLAGDLVLAAATAGLLDTAALKRLTVSIQPDRLADQPAAARASP